MPRISRMTSAITSSATLRVLENGALKTGMPRSSAAVEIHLIGADAEAADAGEPRRAREELAIQVGRRAYADEVCVGRGFGEFPGAQRFLMGLDVAVAIGPKSVRRAGVNSFQQQDLDFALVERSFAASSS